MDAEQEGRVPQFLPVSPGQNRVCLIHRSAMTEPPPYLGTRWLMGEPGLGPEPEPYWAG